MSMTRSRYGQTVYLKGSRAVPLRRRRLDRDPGGGGYDEDWLQQLLFDARNPPYRRDRSRVRAGGTSCRELPTDAALSVAYVSEQGLLSIVECKLWRNPEARRDAVTQILDYAKEISRWSYEDLNDAVCRANTSLRTPHALYDLVRKQVDEADFVDDVTRSLKAAAFCCSWWATAFAERIADYLKQSAATVHLRAGRSGRTTPAAASSSSRGCSRRHSRSSAPWSERLMPVSWWKTRRPPTHALDRGSRKRSAELLFDARNPPYRRDHPAFAPAVPLCRELPTDPALSAPRQRAGSPVDRGASSEPGSTTRRRLTMRRRSAAGRTRT